jgi:exopolyphosphatase / guanosine-5'-triphosphate,3'-diphosphate pyrophosphatase
MAKRRVGAIDIGTNTVLLLVAEGPVSAPLAILERATITRLGKGVDRTRRLAAEAIDRTVACLEGYADLLRQLHVERTIAVCTSAARDAENGNEFLDRARQALGSAPRIIDGDEEARLVFDGALTGLDVEGPVTVFDIGGGSTEVIFGDRTGALASLQGAVSVNIGSVRLTERHVHHDPPEPSELDAVRKDIDDALSTIAFERLAPLVGVAGTMTTLAAIDRELDTYDPAIVHGAALSRARIELMFDRLAAMPLDRRRGVRGLDPARADVIVAGTLIALRLLDRARANEVTVSDRGVRWGLAKAALSSISD